MAFNSTPPDVHEPLVRFEENLAVRRFVLNRPEKLNALNPPMFEALARQIEQ